MEQRIRTALAQDLERHWKLPAGVLSQGRITHSPSDSSKAIWTAEGGVVACSDADLAARVAEVIAEHEPRRHLALLPALREMLSQCLPTASCSLQAYMYCCVPSISPKAEVRDTVEMLAPGAPGLPELTERTEHVFAIRVGSVIAAYAWNIPRHEIDDHLLHAVGVGTHRDYRNRGLGRRVVAALLEHIASEGGVGLWSCDMANPASYRLARSAGFADHVFVFSWEVSEGEATSERVRRE